VLICIIKWYQGIGVIVTRCVSHDNNIYINYSMIIDISSAIIKYMYTQQNVTAEAGRITTVHSAKNVDKDTATLKPSKGHLSDAPSAPKPASVQAACDGAAATQAIFVAQL
jgi:hypothetical protein